ALHSLASHARSSASVPASSGVLPGAAVRSPCFPVCFLHYTSSSELYPLSLHDALPIWGSGRVRAPSRSAGTAARPPAAAPGRSRSEEHTSELQSRENLVCRLLLEKKNAPRPRREPLHPQGGGSARAAGPRRGWVPTPPR